MENLSFLIRVIREVRGQSHFVAGCRAAVFGAVRAYFMLFHFRRDFQAFETRTATVNPALIRSNPTF